MKNKFRKERIMNFKKLLIVLVFACACLFTACTANDQFYGVNTDVTIDQKVIYDANGVKISTKSLIAQAWKDGRYSGANYYLNFDVENSWDKQLYVCPSTVCVNGILFPAWGSAYIDAGTTGELKLDITPAYLQDYGITLVKDIELSFLLSEAGSEDNLIITELITITTSADENYVQPIDDEGVVVYSGDEANIVIKLTEDNELRLYAENKYGQNINIEAKCISVNGTPSDHAESVKHIPEGKKAYEFISYPRDLINKKGKNEFKINIAIFDDLADNLALAEPMKDLGTITVTFGNDN